MCECVCCLCRTSKRLVLRYDFLSRKTRMVQTLCIRRSMFLFLSKVRKVSNGQKTLRKTPGESGKDLILFLSCTINSVSGVHVVILLLPVLIPGLKRVQINVYTSKTRRIVRHHEHKFRQYYTTRTQYKGH